MGFPQFWFGVYSDDMCIFIERRMIAVGAYSILSILRGAGDQWSQRYDSVLSTRWLRFDGSINCQLSCPGMCFIVFCFHSAFAWFTYRRLVSKVCWRYWEERKHQCLLSALMPSDKFKSRRRETSPLFPLLNCRIIERLSNSVVFSCLFRSHTRNSFYD